MGVLQAGTRERSLLQSRDLGSGQAGRGTIAFDGEQSRRWRRRHDRSARQPITPTRPSGLSL